MSKPKRIHSDCAHRWAHQIGDYAEVKGGRLFFRGDTIYSYGNHFPIARHVKVKSTVSLDGFDHCVLFTTRTYSVTTARHVQEVSRSIPGSVTVFHVDNVRAESSGEHTHNLDDYRERITITAGNAKRARSNKNFYIDKLHTLLSERNRYLDFFQLDAPRIEPGDEVVEQFAKVAEIARKEELEREKERQLQAEFHNQEDIAKWLVGESSHFPYSVLRVYLRKSASHNLETSQGAIVPLEHARKVFGFVKQCRDNAQEYYCNGRSIHIGHYTIDYIDKLGNVRAGCHNILWPEIEDFARKEGWLEAKEVVDQILKEETLTHG